ncbi:MAG TPA: response regulator, partial [Burkholderiales bacterium]|nr:response regulator [Burkholderiales bacterium]
MSELRATVLVIEDEPEIRRFLRSALGAEGYRVVEAEGGARGVAEAGAHKPDLAIVDLGLPDLDGIEVIRRIRAWSPMPIVVLSARAQEKAKVEALDAGADDYVTKPFGVGELVARIRSVFRRTSRPVETNTFKVGEVTVNVSAHTLQRGKQEPEQLSFYEVELLRFLNERAGQPV